MKIWITGASGMLGTELASKLSSHDLLLTGRSDLDISNENAVLNFCKQNKPDTVINSAAFTNVDACETEKDLAWMVNAWGCRNLALACSTVGSRLISISTDYVFEGDFSDPIMNLTSQMEVKLFTDRLNLPENNSLGSFALII